MSKGVIHKETWAGPPRTHSWKHIHRVETFIRCKHIQWKHVRTDTERHYQAHTATRWERTAHVLEMCSFQIVFKDKKKPHQYLSLPNNLTQPVKYGRMVTRLSVTFVAVHESCGCGFDSTDIRYYNGVKHLDASLWSRYKADTCSHTVPLPSFPWESYSVFGDLGTRRAFSKFTNRPRNDVPHNPDGVRMLIWSPEAKGVRTVTCRCFTLRQMERLVQGDQGVRKAEHIKWTWQKKVRSEHKKIELAEQKYAHITLKDKKAPKRRSGL